MESGTKWKEALPCAAKAPSPKRTATMNKQLTTTANSWDFFSNKKASTVEPSKKIILVAVELRYPENVGALIRVAGNIGCERVIITGDESNFRGKKIRSSATSTGFNKVRWEFCEETEWPSKVPADYTIVAVETVSGATNLYQTTLPDKVVFVVGNESFGITEWSLQRCNQSIYIPMPGICKSLNVTQAATICMFEWYRQAYA